MTTRQRWILVAAIVGSGIVFLDSTVVNVALPRIGHDLPRYFVGVLEGQSYVYVGYLLTLSALLILAGALSDEYGRRRIFTIGLAGFGVTSVLCGIAPTMETLIVARVLQGAAGALLVPGSLALLRANFGGEQQGRAYGIWAAASSATTLAGPFLGGILVDTISWRMVFLINLPLVAVGLYAAIAHVPESRDEQMARGFDIAGALLAVLAVGGLSIGGIYGEQREWRDPVAYVMLAVGAVATIAFPFLMARSRHPLVPLGLFRSRNFSVTNVSTLLIYGALYVNGQYLALFQQGTLGYTAAAAGIGFIPGSLLLVLLSSRFGTLAGRYGPRWFMALGPAIMGLGVLLYARIPDSSVPWRLSVGSAATFVPPASYLLDFLPASIVFGLGLGVMVAPLTTALMTSVPEHNSGVASAVNNALSRVGPQLLGAVIFAAVTAVFFAALAQHLPGVDTTSAHVRQVVGPLNRPTASPGGVSLDTLVRAAISASTQAFHVAMLISAALLFIGAAVNAVGIRNVKPGEVKPAATAEAAASSA